MGLIYNRKKLKITRKKLRNEATETEKILWEELKNSKLMWLKFRRQHSINRYILDFYNIKYKLCIEIDWKIHLEIKEYDEIRTEYLNAFWIKVVRFTNEEILENIVLVLNKIKKEISNLPHLTKEGD